MRRVAVPLGLTPQGARPREGRRLSLSGPTMGVRWTLEAHAPDAVDAAVAAEAVQAACDRVVAQMSSWEPGSDLSLYNRAPAGSWVALPPELSVVVHAALELAQESGGAFDPTLGTLVDLWGFGPAGAVQRPPGPDAREAARVGWRSLRFDGRGRLFQPGGLALDLSGIAKGYGVDLAAATLLGLGVRDFLIEIGGELRGAGVKGDGEPWWVEIERPPGADLAEPPVLVALHGLSIATSGDWRRGFTADGHRYSHTLNPAARAPVEGDLAAVTVLHRECMQADGLATALTVLGPEAQAFAEARGIAALLVRRMGGGFEEWLSPAFARLLD